LALASLLSRGQAGLDAYPVTVEVHLAGGLPTFAVTGLPAAAVRESKDRVRAALASSGHSVPVSRVTVHLGPADIPKQGSRFDLPIALGVIMAEQDRRWPVGRVEFLGELALSGELRPIRGALPAVLAARDAGHAIVLPAANAREAALIPDAEVFAAVHLNDVVRHLDGAAKLARVAARPEPAAAPKPTLDLADVRGQTFAKRALTVAAAGGHNLLMVGPPGSGKSMLAERLPDLLPPLDRGEMLRVASIASLAGELAGAPTLAPPFRAPHHTTSAQALVGGGTRPRPGEVSLAHRGVLFLDELPEFSRGALEALREPLESGVARISRVHEQLAFPAEFQLVAAMNPCFCGHLGDGTDRCRCTPARLEHYRQRISGPLLDRFDLRVTVRRPRVTELLGVAAGERSEGVAGRVAAARELAWDRQGCVNSMLTAPALAAHAPLSPAAERCVADALRNGRLSARGYHRVIRVARTVADLQHHEGRLEQEHVVTALHLRTEVDLAGMEAA
jgi:magnesium chelatase family protein